MAAVESTRSRFFNKVAILIVLVLTVIYLIPLYWIGSTAFKPRAAATTVPPTVFYKPEVTPFVKLFTKRVQLRKAVSEDKYEQAKWYEKLVYDAGERIITRSPFLNRF
jgi:multiple sugar transport system permease protein